MLKLNDQNIHTLNILFVLRVLSLFTSIHSPISTFKKSLTSDDLNKFIQEDNFKCLIVEAINERAYGFNLSNDVEKAAAIQVVNNKDDFTVVGWSIGENIPNWVKSFEDWMNYIGNHIGQQSLLQGRSRIWKDAEKNVEW